MPPRSSSGSTKGCARFFEEMTNISKDLRRELAETACISNIEAGNSGTGGRRDPQVPFQPGGRQGVEAVLIPIEGRNTLCISSQVGCAMACEFCLTGTFRLTRNLTTAEIINQIMAVKRDLICKPPALSANAAEEYGTWTTLMTATTSVLHRRPRSATSS